ncbi:accessory factor UbiK family protein [Methylobrevis pamukkalensis]|uniref:Membrane fusogenic activity n=1 Tax=Methylobrevis pamukkalensis TaxID=1439726 RepID=A0A1E3H598_9HYPH|nr:Membrane fusogenic activity [Methylobrevis pamukkalensis]
MFRSQGERFVSEMDLAKREDIEIVRELAVKALAEVERLTRRIEDLEARLPTATGAGPLPDEPVDGA